MSSKSTFLMCPPCFYEVAYVINPWMSGKEGTVQYDLAKAQWQALYDLLTQLGAQICLADPAPGLPDIVFTANAALVSDTLCVPAHFRFTERQGEEPIYTAFFRDSGFELAPLPDGVTFEGAGDALFDARPSPDGRPLLWAASGRRTSAASHGFLAETFGAELIPLALVDPRFYHLDTCFCPLPGGELLWYPTAFDAESQARVEQRIPANLRFAVPESAALSFACNAVAVDRTIIMHTQPADAFSELKTWLSEHNFELITTELGEFLKAGGSAKCLTLALSWKRVAK